MKPKNALIITPILIALSVSSLYAQEGPPTHTVTLPSGNQAIIYYTITAGDLIIAAGLMVVAAALVFTIIQSWARGIRAK